MKNFWLRSEIKQNEKRTAITPTDAGSLIKETGCEIFVEKSSHRIFDDSEFKKEGCKLVKAGTWKDAPENCYILGLKELPEDNSPLVHNHIYFAHIFKGQEGAEKVFDRFSSGSGLLFDLEFLLDENERRVAAFGKWAGFVGAAVALDHYYDIQNENEAHALHGYANQDEFIESILNKKKSSKVHPKTIIIGAKGRCGSGAIEALKAVGLEATEWDFEETRKGGPFREILEHNIFINTVLMTKKIAPFLDKEILQENQRLQIISDVSCDPNSDLNPIPIYDDIASWDEPFLKVPVKSSNIDLLAVDNLPSVLPKESSEDFSSLLLPHLIDLANKDFKELPVWNKAYEIFKSKQ